jgi:hypothetical protein
MNTTEKRRTLMIAPVAVAVVLSLTACGSPFKAGSSAGPTSTSTSSGTDLSNNSANSAAGGSAVGGQGGVSSGGSAAAGSATPGQAGVGTGGFGNSNPAASMTPDQVAAYCTGFPYDPTIVEGLVNQDVMDSWTNLRKVTPVQLVPNVDLMISDYQAIKSEKRIYAQLKDELVANFKPLQDFHDQICVAH